MTSLRVMNSTIVESKTITDVITKMKISEIRLVILSEKWSIIFPPKQQNREALGKSKCVECLGTRLGYRKH